MSEEKKYKFICGQHNIRTNNPMIWQSHIRAKHPDIQLNPEGQIISAEVVMKPLVEEKMEILPPPELPLAPEELARETGELERADEEIKKLPVIAKMNEEISGLKQALTQTNEAMTQANIKQEKNFTEMTRGLDTILGKLSEPPPPKASPEPIDVGKAPSQSAQSRLDATMGKTPGETPSGAGPKEQTMEELRQKMASGAPGNTPPTSGQQPAPPATEPSPNPMAGMDPKAAQVLMYASAFAEILDKLPFWKGRGGGGEPPVESKTFLGAFEGFIGTLTKLQDITSRAEVSAENRIMNRLKFMFKLAPQSVTKALSEEETKPETGPGGGESRTHLE